MHCLHVKQGPFVVAFAGNTVGHQVFFNRSSARNTKCHAVLWYQRNAQIAHHTLGLIQHRFPIDRNRPAVRRIQAEQHVYQLSLPVALNTRNAQYLAFAHVKGNPVQHFFVPLVRIFQIPDLKHDFRRHSLLLLHRQDNITPYHQAGDFLLGNVSRIVNAHGFAATHNGHPIRNLFDFVQLMGNEYQGIALLFKLHQLLEQLFRFLCRQNGSRLVQNQYLCTAHQCFQYFHLLLHADRNISYFRVRVNLQVILLGIFLRNLYRFFVIQKQRFLLWFHAKHHVFRNRQVRHKHKMLVYHANPFGNGSRW